MIHDTTKGFWEIPIEEIELSDKNVNVTEDDNQTLETTIASNVEVQPPVTLTTNSPRFTEFIKMVQRATTSSPNLNRPDVEQPLNSPGENPTANPTEGENKEGNEELP